MAGKQRGQFLVSESNGSKVNGQVPSLRVRLADSGVVVACVKAPRSSLLTWMRNNPRSEERKALEIAMLEQGYTLQDVHTVLSK